jgi:hypothetical protein
MGDGLIWEMRCILELLVAVFLVTCCSHVGIHAHTCMACSGYGMAWRARRLVIWCISGRDGSEGG